MPGGNKNLSTVHLRSFFPRAVTPNDDTLLSLPVNGPKFVWFNKVVFMI